MSKQTLWTAVAVTFAFASWPAAAMLSGGQLLPGLPIAREPHHHLVFENEFVKVYEVEVGTTRRRWSTSTNMTICSSPSVTRTSRTGSRASRQRTSIWPTLR